VVEPGPHKPLVISSDLIAATFTFTAFIMIFLMEELLSRCSFKG